MTTNADRLQKIDMSPAAIDRRLRELGQLYELGMSLQKARRIGKVAAATQPETSKEVQ